MVGLAPATSSSRTQKPHLQFLHNLASCLPVEKTEVKRDQCVMQEGDPINHKAGPSSPSAWGTHPASKANATPTTARFRDPVEESS